MFSTEKIKPKIGVIIQARMGSERLPGKVLIDIAGKPMLWHVVERVKSAKTIGKIIIATTTDPEDDKIEDLAKKENWLLYRGSKNDVLGRYYEAAKKFGIDVIVRVTSDCPLIDPFIIDLCVEKFLAGDYDFISNYDKDSSTFPRGLDVRVFSFSALEKAYQNAKNPYEREHVTPYIFENANKEFRLGPVIEASGKYKGNYRLTVDYPEDLELMEKIYGKFYKPGEIIDIKEVISYLSENPGLSGLNEKRQQKSYK